MASFSSLEGKLRASGKEYFGDFQLADDKALHVVLSGNNTQHHLLIGKKEGSQGGAFIRHAEGSDVYLCDKDLLRALDLWGDAEPSSGNWIEKTIFKLDKEQIQEVAYNVTGKQFVFSKLEKKAENQNPGEKDEKKDAEKKPEVKKEYEWKLTDWDKKYEVNEPKIRQITTAVATLSAENAVDPIAYTDDIFKKTNCSISITTSGNTKHVFRFAIQNEQYYVKQDGLPFVYKIASYEKNRIMPNVGEFLKIRIPEIADIEAGNIIDYRTDPDWKGSQETTKKEKQGDKTVHISYAPEDNAVWLRFDTDQTLFAFDKSLYEKLNEKEEKNK